MNEALRSRLSGIREILMAHHKASALLPNSSKGNERETLAREFLHRVFPAPYRFGSGAIADAQGLTTGQLDIVVEFPFFASFPAPGGGERLYVAESVACVAEVKSDLAAQWGQVERTTEGINPLRRKWRGHLQVDSNSRSSWIGPSISRIPVIAIGFKGFSSVKSLNERLGKSQKEKRPDCALVIESGAYVGWGGHLSEEEEGFFAFCADLSYFMRNVLSAEPDLIAHVGRGFPFT